ncbi:MAG: alpha-L-fucosidase [Oscillospiraceae bacterium]|nr:alpha-L-fucosidase [Oscillospiraceae bacterium]
MTQREYLKTIDEVIENGKYSDDWASLSGRKTPDWYYNGKFGIFIHWGIYSVPAYGSEWYSRNMYVKGSEEYEHHLKTYGPHKEFGYKDFIPMFKGERFDGAKWIELFKKAGAKFVMPVAEHHDGFAMYDTEFNRWNAKNMGPKQDVIGVLKAECEKSGLVFCTSSHRAEHYFFMNGGRTFDSDVNDPEYQDFYGPAFYDEKLDGSAMHKACDTVDEIGPDEAYLKDWLCRTCELVDRYRPKTVYFDWWIHNKAFKPYLKKFAAYYYNRAEEWQEEVTIDYKHNAYPPTTATYDVERGALDGISPTPWQTDTAIGNTSWGYTVDNDFKSSYEIITTLIDVVSKNGMFLLNVGPKPDGTITDEETAVLLKTGEWLGVNGEGIYETSPWRAYREGEHQAGGGMFSEGRVDYDEKDFRFTYKKGAVYAFQMKAPAGTAVTIKSFHNDRCGCCARSVSMLGNGNAVKSFAIDEDGLHIVLDKKISSEFPVCYKIELE